MESTNLDKNYYKNDLEFLADYFKLVEKIERELGDEIERNRLWQEIYL